MIWKAVWEIIKELIITLIITVIVGVVLLITSCMIGIPVLYHTGAFEGFYVGGGIGICLCLFFYYRITKFLDDVVEIYIIEHSK